MPSQTAMVYRKHAEKRENMHSANLNALLSKYGGESHMGVPEHLKVASRVGQEEAD